MTTEGTTPPADTKTKKPRKAREPKAILPMFIPDDGRITSLAVNDAEGGIDVTFETYDFSADNNPDGTKNVPVEQFTICVTDDVGATLKIGGHIRLSLTMATT